MAFHSLFLVFLAGLAFCSEAAPSEPLGTKEPLFIKVVDAVRGSPAANVPVMLYKEIGDGIWKKLKSHLEILYKDTHLNSWMLTEALETHLTFESRKAISRQTNDKGGLPEFTNKEEFVPGLYRLELDTATYWRSLGLNPFHHHVDVEFTANDAGLRNYKIVVIITPFSYSTTAVVSDPVA